MKRLDELVFDNSYSRLPSQFHEWVTPTAVPEPFLVAFNPDAARLLDLDPACAREQSFVETFAGNCPLPGGAPIAMRYSGHQFGHYVSQLGDGRALLLGEVRNSTGEKWDLHLKGAGMTPFSRGGDGRAVLRSTIREYLACEALHALGIPTTRALCIVGSPLPVRRETMESAALLVRMAPSHVRFGSFEILAANDDHAALRALVNHVIEGHFPSWKGMEGGAARLLFEVATRTARLIAEWQSIGFAHGVMNTDNMSILGLTLDYGPYGFVEAYDPGFVCNHSDHTGRYALDRQPHIGLWNLSVLARALLPLMSIADAEAALAIYQSTYLSHYLDRMRARLGLETAEREDGPLITGILQLLHAGAVDYTRFFRALCRFRRDGDNLEVRGLLADGVGFDSWVAKYRARLDRERLSDEERRQKMERVNPKYILRNYLAQQAIDRALSLDFSEVEKLREILSHPFDEQMENDVYASAPPAWSLGLEVSCSS